MFDEIKTYTQSLRKAQIMSKTVEKREILYLPF